MNENSTSPEPWSDYFMPKVKFFGNSFIHQRNILSVSEQCICCLNNNWWNIGYKFGRTLKIGYLKSGEMATIRNGCFKFPKWIKIITKTTIQMLIRAQAAPNYSDDTQEKPFFTHIHTHKERNVLRKEQVAKRLCSESIVYYLLT